MDTRLKKVLFSAFLLAFAVSFFPAPLHAASSLEISGWLPYWSAKGAIKDAKKHLDDLAVIHPFGYTVKNSGELVDTGKFKKNRNWKDLFKRAQRKDVLVIPSVTWSNTGAMFTVLGTPALRKDHIQGIVDEVDDRNYDGIDINYEGKSSATKDYFSTFLRELKDELGHKILSCSIEARTPPESLYVTVPDVIPYANDLDAIAEYCDRINIMTYDQQRADLDLNKERKGTPYAPVADADWVEKVLDLMLETLPAEKVSLGVATYGHEFEVVTEPDWYRYYSKTRALNVPAIEKLIKKYKVDEYRNSAGELGASYFPSKHAPQLSYDGDTVAEQTLNYANATGNTAVFYFLSWSDAEAIEEKVKLAEKYDLNGVALFKIDGQEDKNIWKLF